MNLNITYVTTCESISPDQLRGFFVGWSNPPSREIHLALLRNSSHVVLAVDTESDRVIGFVTAISDGVLCAYLPLLEVLPEFRHRGIGAELVKRILDQNKNLYMVDLVCDESLIPFYERLGLKPVRAMVQRNYSRQSGV